MRQNYDHGITLNKLKAVVQYGASPVEALVFGRGDAWFARVDLRDGPETLLTARGNPKKWRSLDTAVVHMRNIGIGRVVVDTTKYDPAQRQLIAA